MVCCFIHKKKKKIVTVGVLQGFEPLRDMVLSDIQTWKDYKNGPGNAQLPEGWETGGMFLNVFMTVFAILIYVSKQNANLEWEKTLEKLVIQKVFRPDQMIRSAKHIC